MVVAVTGSTAPLGRALSDVLAQTLIKHKAATIGAEAEAKDAFVTATMEKMEAELRPTVAGFLSAFADHDNMPPGLRTLASAGVGPTHQVDFLVQLLLGIIGGALMIPTFAAPIWQSYLNSLWAQYTDIPLTPAELATAVTKGQLGFGLAADEAAKSGLDEPNFETLVNTTGNPPGPTELMAMLRRGIIDEHDFGRGIAAGLIKTEWVNQLLALRFSPMSAGDAINAAVEGHLTYDEAKRIAVMDGLLPEHFEPLYQAGGSPPGVNDIGDLLNRGIWQMPQAEAAMRESRVKPKYEADVLKLREQLPPREAIVLMVERGVIAQDVAVRKAMQLGYNQENATFLVQEALNRKLGTEKNLAKGEITQLYAVGVFSRQQASDFIQQLHYDSVEAGFILDLVDAQLARAQVNSAISKIRSLFVSYRIDEPEASLDLTTLGVATVKRDQMLAVWRTEREANAKDLTLGQLTAAYSAQIITEAQYVDRMQQMGYSRADAAIILQLHSINPAAAAG